ncbi:hypothetical protein [Geosporobacter ferrireducens]|uniref:Uncharacterized protein n=1 Tax=Geosporobacter ferrireducens TaxID=1424294 RepID=A0A1D8GDG1_9FIRM|nr:hypothetical protein [Geosporobacter ferrireducens]AOT68937.1 hypothetical protein Gferi_04835 [Geosporobacter ferrireducens]MTI54822.1 hypothetical protein [Geosporobacter ferrireducens]
MIIKTCFEFLWKGLIIGSLNLFSLILAGAVLTNLGLKFPEVKSSYGYITFIMFLSGFIVSVIFGIVAKKLSLSKLRVFIVLFVMLVLNSVTQILEAFYFAPGIVNIEVAPAIFGQQVIMWLFISAGIAFLYRFKSEDDIGFKIQSRSWIDWIVRIIISSGSYVLFYYVFGSINALLFTGEYYLSQVNGLQIPSATEIIVLETIRAIILVLSILPVILNLKIQKKEVMITVGMVLFIIGGLLPMLQQFNSLPTVLIVASTVEMFFQFFLTGVVTTYIILYDKGLPSVAASE